MFSLPNAFFLFFLSFLCSKVVFESPALAILGALNRQNQALKKCAVTLLIVHETLFSVIYVRQRYVQCVSLNIPQFTYFCHPEIKARDVYSFYLQKFTSVACIFKDDKTG